MGVLPGLEIIRVGIASQLARRANYLWPHYQEGEKQDNARWRAQEYDECDWCGGSLGHRYHYCNVCGENFCSRRCLAEHNRADHGAN